MADPIVEQVVQNILTTLGTVTTANGYNYDLTIQREKRYGNQPQNLLAVLHQSDPRPCDDEVNLKKGWFQPFTVEVYITIPEDQNDTTYPDQVLNRIWGDIAKALMVDRYRGGLAKDTNITGWAAFSLVNGGFEGRDIEFEVEYRTDELNPYTLG